MAKFLYNVQLKDTKVTLTIYKRTNIRALGYLLKVVPILTDNLSNV